MVRYSWLATRVGTPLDDRVDDPGHLTSNKVGFALPLDQRFLQANPGCPTLADHHAEKILTPSPLPLPLPPQGIKGLEPFVCERGLTTNNLSRLDFFLETI